MCSFCAEHDRWPVDVTYRFYPIKNSNPRRNVCVCLSDKHQSLTMSYNMVSDHNLGYNHNRENTNIARQITFYINVH